MNVHIKCQLNLENYMQPTDRKNIMQHIFTYNSIGICIHGSLVFCQKYESLMLFELRRNFDVYFVVTELRKFQLLFIC